MATCTLTRPLLARADVAVVRADQECGKGWTGVDGLAECWAHPSSPSNYCQPTIIIPTSINTSFVFCPGVPLHAPCTIHGSVHAASLHIHPHSTISACVARLCAFANVLQSTAYRAANWVINLDRSVLQ